MVDAEEQSVLTGAVVYNYDVFAPSVSCGILSDDFDSECKTG